MSSESRSSQITYLLHRAFEGKKDAEQILIAQIYDQLLDEARRILNQNSGSMNTNCLVDDVWICIFRGGVFPKFDERNAFFAYAATAMRNLLTDHIRHKQTLKAGGNVKYDQTCPDSLVSLYEQQAAVDLMDLNEALEELKAENERQFRTVEMKFFSGSTMQQIADFHRVSLKTAENDWSLARAKLRRRLERGHESLNG